MSKEEQNFTDAQLLRMNAEKKLKDKLITPAIPTMEADVKRLLHELQVHQIELEMQNEELRLANETAETALKKYTLLYDFAPMGYFTLDLDGNIRELNFTGAELLDDRRFSLVNNNFKLYISEESLPEFNRFFSKVFASNSKESCEVTINHHKTPSCTVYLEGIVTGDDRNCLLSVIDISAFRKAGQ